LWCDSLTALSSTSSPDSLIFIFFLLDTAPPEIYTLSLHDALPISPPRPGRRSAPAFLHLHAQSSRPAGWWPRRPRWGPYRRAARDRKSTRLNSSHVEISYAVFCLKKKRKNQPYNPRSRAHPASIQR